MQHIISELSVSPDGNHCHGNAKQWVPSKRLGSSLPLSLSLSFIFSRAILPISSKTVRSETEDGTSPHICLTAFVSFSSSPQMCFRSVTQEEVFDFLPQWSIFFHMNIFWIFYRKISGLWSTRSFLLCLRIFYYRIGFPLNRVFLAEDDSWIAGQWGIRFIDK